MRFSESSNASQPPWRTDPTRVGQPFLLCLPAWALGLPEGSVVVSMVPAPLRAHSCSLAEMFVYL